MTLHICMIFFVAGCWLVALAKLDQIMNSSPLVQNVQNKCHVFKLTLKKPAETNENFGIIVPKEEKEKVPSGLRFVADFCASLRCGVSKVDNNEAGTARMLWF